MEVKEGAVMRARAKVRDVGQGLRKINVKVEGLEHLTRGTLGSRAANLLREVQSDVVSAWDESRELAALLVEMGECAGEESEKDAAPGP